MLDVLADRLESPIEYQDTRRYTRSIAAQSAVSKRTRGLLSAMLQIADDLKADPLADGSAEEILRDMHKRHLDTYEREVGLLWLGEEFAQLDEEFCRWNRSRSAAPCSGAALNRSAFIAWIDCRL